MFAIELQTDREKVLFRSSDYSGYELCWLRSQKGEQVWTPEKFFANIEQALQNVMELKFKAADIHTLAELKSQIEKARADIVTGWKIKPDLAG